MIASQKGKEHQRNSPKRRALISQLLFQLDQLSFSNSHHEFEHICRHLARETITPNILPATGPVTAGGDEGRDFETFTTFIGREETRTSLFRGVGESKPLVFACSITKRKRIKAKIKADLAKIFERESPHLVYFFSNQSIPVALRLEIQTESIEKYRCRLEILDVQAIAEQLSDARVFWIAEEYLHVPNDLFPEPRALPESTYSEARSRWLEEERTPYSFADFVSIKYGLRSSTFEAEFKPDLKRWIAAMERLLTAGQSEALSRRAKYEICVATLRGLHDLRPRTSMVHEYLADWSRWTKPAEIRDSALLLSYASAAVLHREFDADSELLHRYSKEITNFVDAEIAAATESPNRQAALLYTRSSLAALPFLNSTDPSPDLSSVIEVWFKLLNVADRAPLFEFESFVDGLSKLTPVLSDHPDFPRLLRRADEVLERRTSGFVVAEKCRDRAMALIEQGQTLAGMEELHRVKVKWFTGDTLRPSVLALLTLSSAYRKLGMLWAAKHYALAAAFIVSKAEDDHLMPLMVSALHEAAACCYDAGEWIAFSDLMPLIVAAHYQFVSDPDNWEEHERLKATIYHFFVARSLAKALNGEKAAEHMNAPLASAGFPEDLMEHFLAPRPELIEFESLTATEIREKVQENFHGIPLCDTGPMRTYTWSALGIQWRVTCSNALSTIGQVEQFVAMLQIALVDLASRDLCLLPTNVTIQAELGDVVEPKLEILDGNDASAMKLILPCEGPSTSKQMEEHQQRACAIAIAVLTQCSCLSDKDLMRALQYAFRDGLTSKLFIVRPYSELFLEFTNSENFSSRREMALSPRDASAYAIQSAKELAWRDSPGPGYTAERSRAALKNRYERGRKPIALTLRRLRSLPRFHEWVAVHRGQGRKDWWILLVLMNAVTNYRAQREARSTDPRALREYMIRAINEDERADAIEFPVEALFSDETEMAATSFMMTTANVWHLVIRSRTPDIQAFNKLLNVRYGQSADDIDHDDPFAPL